MIYAEIVRRQAAHRAMPLIYDIRSGHCFCRLGEQKRRGEILKIPPRLALAYTKSMLPMSTASKGVMGRHSPCQAELFYGLSGSFPGRKNERQIERKEEEVTKLLRGLHRGLTTLTAVLHSLAKDAASKNIGHERQRKRAKAKSYSLSHCAERANWSISVMGNPTSYFRLSRVVPIHSLSPTTTLSLRGVPYLLLAAESRREIAA